MGCGIDFGDKGKGAKIWFSLNGRSLGTAFDLPKKLVGGAGAFVESLGVVVVSVRFTRHVTLQSSWKASSSRSRFTTGRLSNSEPPTGIQVAS